MHGVLPFTDAGLPFPSALYLQPSSAQFHLERLTFVFRFFLFVLCAFYYRPSVCSLPRIHSAYVLYYCLNGKLSFARHGTIFNLQTPFDSPASRFSSQGNGTYTFICASWGSRTFDPFFLGESSSVDSILERWLGLLPCLDTLALPSTSLESYTSSAFLKLNIDDPWGLKQR